MVKWAKSLHVFQGLLFPYYLQSSLIIYSYPICSEAVLEHFAIANDKTFGQAATDGRNLVDCYTVYNECKSED